MIESIPAFLAALDTGSIQGAARSLGIARPTVRRRLELLEAEVGVQLLARGHSGLRATAAGEVFARRAREMMLELGGLSRAARAAGASPQGVLRVGLPAGVPPQIVAGITSSVATMWPEVRLELICSTSNADLINRVDCRFSLELEEPGGPVVVTELGVVREQLVASREYLRAHGPIESVRDVLSHKLYAWMAPDTGTPERLPVADRSDLEIEVAMATNDLRSLVWLASEGAGLVFMPFEPALARAPTFGAQNVVPVLADLVGRDRPRRLITAKAVADAPVVAAFLHQTRAVAAVMLAE